MKKILKWFIPGLFLGLLVYWGFEKVLVLTSTNEFCMSCHIHPGADNSWK
ncbi:MAG: NapC/NirT family cytochrome c, partial [Bacteroidales bacterium]